MKEFLEKIKTSKKAHLAVALILCALIAALYFVPQKAQTSSKAEEPVISNSTPTKEEQLEDVLKHLKGVSDVRVMITYQSGSEVVCASTTEKQKNTVTEKNENGTVRESETVTENETPVTLGSGNSENALVIVEKEPEIKGVIVIAKGAERIDVRMNLQKAVETVLQVQQTQVEIFAMN